VTGDDEATARSGYDRLRAAHLHEVRAALQDHVDRVDWPAERIEQYQTERLRALLGYVKERSPFHAARLGGIKPSSATAADLARVAPMEKSDAQGAWDSIVTVPGLDRARVEHIIATQAWFSYTSEGLQVFSSGGSSGVRGVYAWDWDFFVSSACLAWRMQARAERQAAAPPPDGPLCVLEAAEPPHASTPLFDVPLSSTDRSVVIRAGDPFEEVLAAVAAARPAQLVGYASLVGRLARATLAGELDIGPTRVSTNSEPLSVEDREAIREAWDAPIHNLWGSTEIGVQAVGCGVGDGLHINADEVILERVGANGSPVSPDEPAARTLATGLANRTFPFIRYDLGDEVTLLADPCPCGSALPRVAAVEGRVDDDFRYGDVVIPAGVFRHVLGTDPSVSEYQVRQTPTGADVLVVGPHADDAALGTALVASLHKRGLAEAKIDVRTVTALERHADTAKLRRFVPLAP
jgi:phenylacetate-CoA ligase